MAIPRFVRPFTKYLFSPVFRPFASRLPYFGLLTVVGRKSGRRFSTPLNVFHHDGEHVFALTYGSDVNWVQNALASGSAEILERGRVTRLGSPRLFTDPKGRAMPFVVRQFLRLTGVNEYLAMRPLATAAGDRSPSPGDPDSP